MAHSNQFENPYKRFCTEISRLKNQLNDVTIVAGLDKKEFPCHRLVLSACSPYFAKMFTSTSLSIKNIVTINNATGDVLDKLIQFCYSHTIEITVGNVESILKLSHLLQMELVTNKCIEYMIKHLDAVNCCGVRTLAETYNLPTLLNASNQFVLNRFEEVYKNDEFNKLDIKQLINILKSDSLNVSGEEHVFCAIKKWIEHKLDRKKFGEELLSLVRVPYLNREFITKDFENFCEKYNLQRFLLETYKQLYIVCSSSDCHLTPRLSANRNLIAFSLQNSIKAYVYCSFNNTWSLWRELISPKYFDYSKLAVIGLSQDNLFICNQVFPAIFWLININSCEVIEQCDLPASIKFYRVISLDKDLYIVGGINERDEAQNTLRKYNSVTKVWTSLANMSVPRVNHNVVLLNSFIYAIGGQMVKRNILSLFSMERYDFKADKWTSCAPMKVLRKSFDAAALHGYIYVAGGIVDSEFTKANTVERYDPKTDSWTIVASIPKTNWFFGFFTHGNILYAGGGIASDSFYKYDSNKDRWEQLSSLPFRGKTQFSSMKVENILPKKFITFE